MIKIENEELFKEAIYNKINIFAGAGFSSLPNEDNVILKNVKELSKSICETFQIDERYMEDLDKLSELAIISEGKEKFKNFLIKEYTVSSYNKLYDELNKININSFITTNIDNIIHSVIEKSDRYYLCDKTFGAVKRDGIELEYVPLHGCVKNEEYDLFFSKTQIGSAPKLQAALFEIMRVRLSEAPTVFLGYGFHDSSTEYSLSSFFTDRKKEAYWILCPDDSNTEYFKKIGAYIINGTIEDFFIWIRDNIKYINNSAKGLSYKNNFLNKFVIPTTNSIKYTKTMEDYYRMAQTDWYNILYNHEYKTTNVDKIKDIYLKHKNTLVVGVPFSGKTTISMQLSNIILEKNKFYFNKLENNISNLIINNIKKEQVTIIVDNCTDNVKEFINLALCNNIKLVGFTDNMLFESSKFILDNSGVSYEVYDIDDITKEEAQKIYNYIPKHIRRDFFSYKEKNDERFSMFEMMEKNVKNVITKNKVENMLDRINTIEYALDIIALTSYLSKFGSALSTDIMFYYFDDFSHENKYEKIQNIITKIKEFLIDEIGNILDIEKLDQDYYILRSNIFSYYVHEVLIEKYRKNYSEVIKKLIKNVDSIYIVNYKAFSRKAYDAKLFRVLFNKEGLDIYNIILGYDSNNYYTLQQMALYMSEIGKFAEAHKYIDRASNMSPNNYSIKNSRAIILFEANKNVDKNNENKGIKNLKEAMNILDNCRKNDSRKVYHSQKYAEFAIFLSERFNINDYLSQSLEWLQEFEIIMKPSIYTKSLINKLKNMI